MADKTAKKDNNNTVAESIAAEVVDLKHDIPQALREWALSELAIDDPVKLTQGQFNAGLMYIQDRFIQPLCLLKPQDNNNGGYVYNHDSLVILLQLVNIYINTCMLYDKHVCFIGFSLFSGVSTDTFDLWANDRKASREHIEIIKKIREFDEESLQDILVTGRRNPVGVVAVLNNKHGWSDHRITHQTERTPESNAQIAARLGVQQLTG